LAGHLAPVIGSIAEKNVKILLELLGYGIIRENVIQPNIDKIINFLGEPIPIPPNPCKLEQPIYSPDGYIAVSIKKGDFSDGDVTSLINDIAEAQNHETDHILQKVEGGLILSNALKLPSEINNYRERGIFCWDISRLFFYSAKAKNSQELSKIAPVKETIMDEGKQISYLRQWNISYELKNTIVGKFILFIDNHESEFIYSTDHNNEILDYIYKVEINPFIEDRDLSVYSYFEIHVLGKANEDLVKTSYINFAREHAKNNPKEIGVTYSAELPIYHYSVSPWAILLT